MENVYDIRQYLKKFGTIIYTKDPIGDLHLMADDLQELYKAGILPIRDY